MSRSAAVLAPPRARPIAQAWRLDQLWSLLTDEQRQRTLVTLSGIVRSTARRASRRTGGAR